VIPDAPSSVITENQGTSVKILWAQPYNGGDPINQYIIQILQADGTFSSTPSCDGSLEAVIVNTYCVIPMNILISAPYNLQEGNIISAIVKSQNRIGQSAFSTANSLGAVIQAVPHKPILPPYSGSLTDTS
jgi:hypothetical protein